MQAFLNGKSREESITLQDAACKRVVDNFLQTGEIDPVENVEKLSECGLRGEIWNIKDVQVVSREFYEAKVGIDIIEMMEINGSDSDDVPELETIDEPQAAPTEVENLPGDE